MSQQKEKRFIKKKKINGKTKMVNTPGQKKSKAIKILGERAGSTSR